jgi:hypothetical protein
MFNIGDHVEVINPDLTLFLGKRGVVTGIGGGNGDVITIQYYEDDRRDIFTSDSFYAKSLSLYKRHVQKGGFGKWISKSVIG